MKSYYSVLDLEHDATDEQIRSQYRQLVRIYHPDRFSNQGDKVYAERKLQEINEAYYGLLAPEKTGKGLSRRLAQPESKDALFSVTPASMMILLSVLFVGVLLGGIDFEALVSDDPAFENQPFPARLLAAFGNSTEAEATAEPIHEWLSFSVFENFHNSIYVVGADGQSQMTVPIPGHSPIWSPSRNRLAFLSTDGDGRQIYTISTGPIETGQARGRSGIAKEELARITQDGDKKEQLAWSPDGSRLIYVAQDLELGTSILKMVNLETNQVSPLTGPRLGTVQNAVWLDSDTILANVENDGETQIFQIGLDGQAASPFVSFLSRDPSVAPNGQRVSLATDEGLYSVLRNGEDVTQLTATPARRPVWSPTGAKIAYMAPLVEPNRSLDEHSLDEQRSALWIVDADGQNQEKITDAGVLSFSWSVDGNALAYVTGNLDAHPPALYLWTVDLEGSSRLIAEISEPHVAWGRGM